jgi:hypothetical protein
MGLWGFWVTQHWQHWQILQSNREASKTVKKDDTTRMNFHTLYSHP